MADKVDKPKKKAKPKKDEKGVLAALPTTRPERIGGRRAAAASTPAPKTAAATSASKAVAAKPAKTATATKPSKAATSAKKSSPAAKSSATARPSSAAAKKTGAVPLSETPREERTYPRPRPVSEGAPGIGTGGDRDQPSPESGRPSGAELAGTAVRAAGEVAQLGLTIGGHVLKRVVDRLPKP